MLVWLRNKTKLNKTWSDIKWNLKVKWHEI